MGTGGEAGRELVVSGSDKLQLVVDLRLDKLKLVGHPKPHEVESRVAFFL